MRVVFMTDMDLDIDLTKVWPMDVVRITMCSKHPEWWGKPDPFPSFIPGGLRDHDSVEACITLSTGFKAHVLVSCGVTGESLMVEWSDPANLGVIWYEEEIWLT